MGAVALIRKSFMTTQSHLYKEDDTLKTPAAQAGTNRRTSVEDRIVKTIAELLGLDESAVQPEKRLVEDFGADSLDGVELAMAIEDEFAIEIDDEQLEKVTTVQSVFDLVNSFVTPGHHPV